MPEFAIWIPAASIIISILLILDFRSARKKHEKMKPERLESLDAKKIYMVLLFDEETRIATVQDIDYLESEKGERLVVIPTSMDNPEPNKILELKNQNLKDEAVGAELVPAVSL